MMKKTIKLVLTVMLAVVLLAGCGSKKIGPGKAFVMQKSDAGFTASGTTSVDDFYWYFKTADYDKSVEVPFSDPYAAEGIWEVCTWRIQGNYSSEVKEVYWMNLSIERKDNGGMLGQYGDVDTQLAADFYANEAFKDSDEAKNAGVQGDGSTDKLIDALNNLDPTVDATATLILVGYQDTNGNWTPVNDGTKAVLTGVYYPDGMFLKLDDGNGHQISANNFLTAGSEQHAIGAYDPGSDNMDYHGTIALTRKVQ